MSAAVRRAQLLRHYAAGLHRAEVLGDRVLANAWRCAITRLLARANGFQTGLQECGQPAGSVL